MSHPDDGVLQELLDGELAPADEAVVRAHIAGCAPCITALAELKAVQLEADAIVTRLDLDPPLPRPASRARPGGRRVNLRMLGLAASAVLVAGTSWVLLRSSPQQDMLSGGAGTGSGVVLPMPGEERAEVPATTSVTPAAPPAAVAGAGAERKDVPDLAKATGNDAFRQQPRKEAAAVAAELDEAPAANAALPMPSVAPAAASRLARAAPKFAAGSPTTISDAEQRLGARLLTISGLTPQSVEVTSDSLPAVRQRYLVDGVPVVLVQTVLPGEKRKAEVLRDEVTAKQGGYVSADAREPVRRYWEVDGNLLLLEGALPSDSIDALMKRVR